MVDWHMNEHMDIRDQETTGSIDTGRRRVLLGGTFAAGTLGMLGLFGLKNTATAKPAGGGPARTPAERGPVQIVLYSDDGQRLGEKRVPRVIKTPAQWQAQLSAASYRITRESGTERPFSGRYVNKPSEPGFYRCICCGNALYAAATQYHSGTGWPSFWQPIAAENVTEHIDHSFGMTRTEIACTRCNAHLGHKFHDGPPPTVLRYCMDSVALRFIATGAAVPAPT
jgi:peptide-methionine (R)-S-oxide reductase